MVRYPNWPAWKRGIILATKAAAIALAIMLVTSTSIIANADNNQVLIEAAKQGELEKVKSLLDGGADINGKDKNGFTALMWASSKGHLEIVKLLLDKGADINARHSHGDIALIMASSEGHLEVVRLLLNNGSDINAKHVWQSGPCVGFL